MRLWPQSKPKHGSLSCLHPGQSRVEPNSMSNPIISIIAVMSPSRAIGCGNRLLWDIPEDMAHFREKTAGHPVIMGRKTFESIGKPLPGRTNIVISLPEENYIAPGCLNANSLDEAIGLGKEHDENELFIIGGGTIYKLALPLADKLYVTVVNDEQAEADTYFPDYSEFKIIRNRKELKTNQYNLVFLELSK